MGVSSTKLDRQQQNFSGHILLSWSVVLQGRPESWSNVYVCDRSNDWESACLL